MNLKRVLSVGFEQIEELKGWVHFEVAYSTVATNELAAQELMADPADLTIFRVKEIDLSFVRMCSHVRSSRLTRWTPIFVLIETMDPEANIQLIELGIETLLPASTSLREIAARVNTLFRKMDESSEHVDLKFCDLRMNLNRMECRVGEEFVGLTVLEFKLLWFLLKNAGAVLTREQILQSVWNNPEVTTRTVDSHVFLLRKKLKSSALTIHSLYGAGYTLRRTEGANEEQLTVNPGC